MSNITHSLVLATLVAFSLSACGGGSSNESTDTSTATPPAGISTPSEPASPTEGMSTETPTDTRDGAAKKEDATPPSGAIIEEPASATSDTPPAAADEKEAPKSDKN